MSEELPITESPSINRIEQEQDEEVRQDMTDLEKFKDMATRTYFSSVIAPRSSVAAAPAPKKKAPRKKAPRYVLKSVKHKDRVVSDENIPVDYRATYVTLIPKDPHCIYAYWEVNGDDIGRLKAEAGIAPEEGTYTLRIYDVTYVDFNGTNANYWFDLDELFMNNRYIPVLADDAVYCAEIGVRMPDGRFAALARSNFVTTPRAHMSARSDLIWKENGPQPEQAVYINVKYLNRKMRGKLASRVNWQVNTSRRTLNLGDIALYYTHNKQLAKQLMNAMKAPAFNSAGQYIAVESSVIPALLKETTQKRRRHASSAEFVQQEKKQKEFPLELKVEVTVHGKTEPGAEVRLGDTPVDVKPDGTFTLTWPLNEGYLPLTFNAFSKAKNMGRSVTTAVLRSPTGYRDTGS